MKTLTQIVGTGLALYILSIVYVHLFNSNTNYNKPTLKMSNGISDEIGQGTGWLVNDTTVVTDLHVIDHDAVYTVINQETGEYQAAEVIVIDKLHDLALLKIPKPMKHMSALCVSGGTPEPGSEIQTYGYGNAYARKFNATYQIGRITGAIPSTDDETLVRKEFQATLTNMLVVPGDSGSPVLYKSCAIANVHFTEAMQNQDIFMSSGISDPGSIKDLLDHNNIEYSSFSFDFWSTPYQRMQKAVVRIAISKFDYSPVASAVLYLKEHANA